MKNKFIFAGGRKQKLSHALRVSPWVHQAGVLHAIFPISMKLGQFKGSTPKTQNDKLVHSLDLYGGR